MKIPYITILSEGIISTNNYLKSNNLYENSLSLREKTPFDVVTIPSILSIWSGIKCPVQYGTIITDEKYRELMSHIDSLTKKE